MKVGEWLKLYREQHNLSMQALADLCGFSKAYINVLEKGVNPKTGKPISPTMQTFEKIARGTKTDVDTLLKILDGDQPITVNAPASDDLPDVSPTGQKIDARTRRQLEAVLDDDNLTYNGVVLNGEDKEKVKKALELIFWDVKEKNKRKK
ncbi:helix-turn-helix transcriptional regulator [Selenomonas sp.]|uniref:helix-turn-helix domain-containing protein n=1 Tax=Selenomonas sp. TaxID=2053611 RepID=UPI001CAFBB55|nr:helix-turn-helix transcriptional regulator [Selenomonas sp.]MBF1694846.1 helix-turn-helix transcriptional regulator [Selenomonas sp.]